MTPLAIIAKEAGLTVSGSDVREEFITDEALAKSHITISSGFSKDNLKDPDLLITTGAHGGFDNPQVKEGKSRKIPVWTQGQAAGEFMKGDIFGRSFSGISVAGSHGKTTTAAIVATILSENNLDPTYLIGTSSIDSLGLPGHYGSGKYFVSEADEYATEPEYDKRPKFLWQHPEIAIITNIELDHPDLYENVERLRENFLLFARGIKKSGVLILCGDDEENKKLIKDYSGNIITYGFSPANDFVIEKYRQVQGKTNFLVSSHGTILSEFSLRLPGQFNSSNALSAIITGVETGLSVEKIKNALTSYRGAKRRFEYIGKLTSGALLFDDYAHHPTEIKKTLKTFCETFKNKKIVCIFQPHTFSRTKVFFEDFTNSFSYADIAVITDIYPSLREKNDPDVSSKLLVEKMSVVHKNVFFLPEIPDVIKYISQKNFDENFVVITMGAGDIYKVKEGLNIIS